MYFGQSCFGAVVLFMEPILNKDDTKQTAGRLTLDCVSSDKYVTTYEVMDGMRLYITFHQSLSTVHKLPYNSMKHIIHIA